MHLLGLEYQALLAEDVLAGQQGVAHDGEVHVQRRHHQHGVEVLARQQLAVILVGRRVAACGRRAFLEIRLIDVANGQAATHVHLGEVIQKILAAAAGPHNAVRDLDASGSNGMNRRRTPESDGGSGGSYTPGASEQVAPAHVA
jgi:hypothetical protein